MDVEGGVGGGRCAVVQLSGRRKNWDPRPLSDYIPVFRWLLSGLLSSDFGGLSALLRLVLIVTILLTVKMLVKKVHSHAEGEEREAARWSDEMIICSTRNVCYRMRKYELIEAEGLQKHRMVTLRNPEFPD